MTHFSKVIVKKIRHNFLEMRSAVSAINSGWDRREYDHNLRGRGDGGGGGEVREGSCGVMILVVLIPAGRPCHTGNRVHILSFSFPLPLSFISY
jgi:hypothetical protein